MDHFCRRIFELCLTVDFLRGCPQCGPVAHHLGKNFSLTDCKDFNFKMSEKVDECNLRKLLLVKSSSPQFPRNI